MGNENGRRKCGRKKTKSSEGKTPQRGMGVAQLEWHMKQGSEGSSKKETNDQNPNMFQYSYAPQTAAVHPFYPSYFTDQAAASRSFGSGQQQGVVVQRLGPNGLILGPGQSSSGFGYVYPDQSFPVLDQYGVGPPNSYSYNQPNTTAGNVNVSCDMSKDMISYVPTIQCRPARVCPKKKRYNGEISESVGGSGEIAGKDSYGSFNGSSIISAGNYKHNYLGQSQDFGTKLSMYHPFPGPKIELQDGGAVDECKAKGSSMRGSRNMLMEYEFFPEKEKGEKSSVFKDWIRLGSESSSVAGGGGYGEANSCLSTTNTSAGFGGASSSSIDLSLKLSY
ncbi:hypothetical protein POM88_010282 [Heracleum sosnowskyi]|uniref:Uncharacterized protein n=1 Tax=Heracleum sosnowskyi TaxID=360622 RepID=A0AAD8IUS7_9APIA|nr:hypothetical protein POM88_010282 [Heracleum sosnowskyi]